MLNQCSIYSCKDCMPQSTLYHDYFSRWVCLVPLLCITQDSSISACPLTSLSVPAHHAPQHYKYSLPSHVAHLSWLQHFLSPKLSLPLLNLKVSAVQNRSECKIQWYISICYFSSYTKIRLPKKHSLFHQLIERIKIIKHQDHDKIINIY